MAIDKAVITKEEARLIEIVAFAEKRIQRAQAKRDKAQQEVDRACDALVAATNRLIEWRDTHPGQSELPLGE